MAQPKQKQWIPLGPAAAPIQPTGGGTGGKQWIPLGGQRTPTGGITPFDRRDPLGQMAREITPDIVKEAQGGIEDILGAFDKPVHNALDAGIAAFHVVVGGARLAFAPLTGAIQSTIADPFERSTGWKGSSEWVNLGVQLATPFGVNRLFRALDRLSGIKAVDQIRAILAPTSRGPLARQGELAIRNMSGLFRQDVNITDNALEHSRAMVDKLSEQAQLDMWHAIETGQVATLSPELQSAAATMRQHLDAWHARLAQEGWIDGYRQNYVPRQYTKPELAEQAEREIDAARQAEIEAAGKRPLLGDPSFRKQRVFPTLRDAMAWTGPNGEKLIPVTTNPIRMATTGITNMAHYYRGRQFVEALKADGLVKFARSGADVARGFARINDPAFKVFMRNDPELIAEMKQALREKQAAAPAREPGVTFKTAKGSTYEVHPDGTTVRNKSFHPEHGVADQGIQPKSEATFYLTDDEVNALGEFQVKGGPGKVVARTSDGRWAVKYTSGKDAGKFERRTAVAGQTAPKVGLTPVEIFDGGKRVHFGNKIVEVSDKPLSEAAGKAGVDLSRAPVPGAFAKLGEWYAPEPVARLINNYVSQGLKINQAGGLGAYARAATNAISYLQLGGSGFHMMFVTFDAMSSRLALGFEQLAKADPRGLFTIATFPAGPFLSYRKGGAFAKAYLSPMGVAPNSQMAKVMELYARTGGGGPNMDKVHELLAGQPVWKRITSGTFLSDMAKDIGKSPLRGTFKAAGDLLRVPFEAITDPVMRYYVPRMKMGVFYDMAQDFLRRNPSASQTEIDMLSVRALDSVDNRLGQMVYDNVYWNKTAKDIAFLTVRSVGWNLGTIRELGGAVFDAVGNLRHLSRLEWSKLELTPRMAYTMAMTVNTALAGSIMTYLWTGKGPQELKDYFFPPTGRLTPTGAKERVSIPGYLKDVVAWSAHPGQTAVNKLNPTLTMLYEAFWTNQDYYNAVIHDPDDPLHKQIFDEMKWVMRSIAPFSLQSFRQLEASGSSWPMALLSSEFGFQKAPGYIVDPAAAAAGEERRLRGPRRAKAREEAQYDSSWAPAPDTPSAPAGKKWIDLGRSQ